LVIADNQCSGCASLNQSATWTAPTGRIDTILSRQRSKLYSIDQKRQKSLEIQIDIFTVARSAVPEECNNVSVSIGPI